MPQDAWKQIEQHPLAQLDQAFAAEPDRLVLFAHEIAGLYFDWSKTHLDTLLVGAFDALAQQRGLAAARDSLFGGEIVNITEQRPADHVAERGSGSPEAVLLANSRRSRMRALVDAVEAGAFGNVTGILHIGIGGSVLGPALLVDALGRRNAKLQVSFLSNIDPQAFTHAVEPLDPQTTLIVAASKTFTTAETLANLAAALDWLRSAGIDDPYGRTIAVTAAPDAAVSEGIDESRVLQFSEGVGGRYSLWSPVSVSAALALGWSAFEEFLEGGAEMDRHFRYSESRDNVVLLAAFADLLYARRLKYQSRAVFPYDERLRLLVPYLQQLEMESNGKSATVDGSPLSGPGAPVVWGGVGTDAQHAVFQLLHQGTAVVPVEFVAVAQDDAHLPGHHRALLLNAFAQGAALMRGSKSEDPHRSYPGNRPSSTILIDRLDARRLGALIAFYEHRTFTNAVLSRINPFDQFGVELGKSIVRELSDDSNQARLDPSTRALIERAAL